MSRWDWIPPFSLEKTTSLYPWIPPFHPGSHPDPTPDPTFQIVFFQCPGRRIDTFVGATQRTARSSGLPVGRSVDRSIDRSIDRSSRIDRSIDRPTETNDVPIERENPRLSVVKAKSLRKKQVCCSQHLTLPSVRKALLADSSGLCYFQL